MYNCDYQVVDSQPISVHVHHPRGTERRHRQFKHNISTSHTIFSYCHTCCCIYFELYLNYSYWGQNCIFNTWLLKVGMLFVSNICVDQDTTSDPSHILSEEYEGITKPSPEVVTSQVIFKHLSTVMCKENNLDNSNVWDTVFVMPTTWYDSVKDYVLSLKWQTWMCTVCITILWVLYVLWIND